MIKDIKSVPVLRPFISLMIGILAEKWFEMPVHWLTLLMITAFLFLLSMLLFQLELKPERSWISGLGVYLFFISAGIMVINRLHSNNIYFPKDYKTCWFGEILTEPAIKKERAYFEMLIYSDFFSDPGFKLQAIMQTDSLNTIPECGQMVVFKSRLERIREPLNPGEFNYAAYLVNRGILYRSFIKAGEWKVINSLHRFSLNTEALRLRKMLWSKIENQEKYNNNLGVLYAIALGSKDLLTPEIREDYAVTGAMHVLVVSGQHVALIWMVLSYIFFWMKNLPGGKFIQFFLVMGLIWFYALMTGMTASIIRSAGMFTLVSLGKVIQKESSVYNSLALSAFFGLLVNPQWLTDAGFQLSYIAVLSIVFFQPRITFLWAPSNWFIKKLWDISSVSIAAQIGTLPLTLYYFNRFPPWFIISNLIVIPLVTVIMIVFIILLIFLIIPFVFSFVLKILLFLIGVMNSSLHIIRMLPSPGMENIYLSDFQMFFLVLTLLGIIFFMQYRKNKFFVIWIASLLVFISLGTFRKFQNLRQTEMILFSVPGKMIMGMVEAKHATFIQNIPDTNDLNNSFAFKCKPFVIRQGIKQAKFIGLSDTLLHHSEFRKIPGNQNYFLRYEKGTLLILNDPLYYAGMLSSVAIRPDIIIVNNRIPGIWRGGNQLFYTNLLLISSSMPDYITFKPGQTGIIQADSIFDTRVYGAFRSR